MEILEKNLQPAFSIKFAHKFLVDNYSWPSLSLPSSPYVQFFKQSASANEGLKIIYDDGRASIVNEL